MKLCAHCKTQKPHSSFHKASHTTDGRQSYCKPCSREYTLCLGETPAMLAKLESKARALRKRLESRGAL